MSAARSKRSLHIHSPAERPSQQGLMQKSDSRMPTGSGEVVGSVAAVACEAALHTAPDSERTNASAAHGPAMSWLPFPAMNADVSWTDLADSDEDEVGWDLRPLAEAVAAPADAPLLHNDGTAPVSGPFIPSFSGELHEDGSAAVTKPVLVTDTQRDRDLSSTSFRLESPTPVAVIQDLSGASKQPSRTQFGFALGSALSSKAALGDVDAFLGAALTDGTCAGGSNNGWAGLGNSSWQSVPAGELVVEARLEAVNPVNSDERV